MTQLVFSEISFDSVKGIGAGKNPVGRECVGISLRYSSEEQ